MTCDDLEEWDTGVLVGQMLNREGIYLCYGCFTLLYDRHQNNICTAIFLPLKNKLKKSIQGYQSIPRNNSEFCPQTSWTLTS